MKHRIAVTLLATLSLVVVITLGSGFGIVGRGSDIAQAGGTPTPTPGTYKCATDANGKCSQLLLQTDSQVCLGLPIFNNGSSCVSNSQSSGGAIVGYLKLVLTLLSGAVGLVVIIMLVTAGLQYITSAGDPALIKSAKNRIVNAITALLLFLMMYAILNFLIPGGIL